MNLGNVEMPKINPAITIEVSTYNKMLTDLQSELVAIVDNITNGDKLCIGDLNRLVNSLEHGKIK